MASMCSCRPPVAACQATPRPSLLQPRRISPSQSPAPNHSRARQTWKQNAPRAGPGKASLQGAAELLAKAAVEHTSSTSLTMSKEAVAELKRIASKLELVEGKLKTLEGAAVVSTLQWAIGNSSLGQFEYSRESGEVHEYYSDVSSEEFVNAVLLDFMTDCGRWLPNGYYIGSGTLDKKSRQAFRDALSMQIHQLTGVKPRIVLQKNGKVDQYAIYRV